MKDIGDRFGAVSVLVNNAGITRDNLLMRMKSDEWDSVVNTNLNFGVSDEQSVPARDDEGQDGRIINIASVVGASGNAGQTNYLAAKAGMFRFQPSLAQEVGSRRITVNAVAPGFIDTDMTRELPDAQRDALLGSIPLGRLGKRRNRLRGGFPLASEAAAYVTGETIHVNGGICIWPDIRDIRALSVF